MNLNRRSAIHLFLASALSGAVVAPAWADAAAETYLSHVLADADAVFGAPDEAARLDAVTKMVATHVDMNKVARFVLGQYARVISREQWSVYRPLFEQYATLVYQKTLKDYAGERLEVVGSIDRSAKDIIVNTKIAGAGPGQRYSDLVVHWRLYRGKDGAFAVVDAGAEGVWLAIEQQSQFKSVIANNGGGARGIDALIADLSGKVGA